MFTSSQRQLRAAYSLDKETGYIYIQVWQCSLFIKATTGRQNNKFLSPNCDDNALCEHTLASKDEETVDKKDYSVWIIF